MTTVWSAEQLNRICRSRELQITSRRTDGTLRMWVSIWVVCVDDDVYVRTWYRRDTGWFGHVIDVPEARIRAADLEADVCVTDVGEGPPECRSRVDAAYSTKYGGTGHTSMVTDAAAATTLRLDPR